MYSLLSEAEFNPGLSSPGEALFEQDLLLGGLSEKTQ